MIDGQEDVMRRLDTMFTRPVWDRYPDTVTGHVQWFRVRRHVASKVADWRQFEDAAQQPKRNLSPIVGYLGFLAVLGVIYPIMWAILIAHAGMVACLVAAHELLLPFQPEA